MGHIASISKYVTKFFVAGVGLRGSECEGSSGLGQRTGVQKYEGSGVELRMRSLGSRRETQALDWGSLQGEANEEGPGVQEVVPG